MQAGLKALAWSLAKPRLSSGVWRVPLAWPMVTMGWDSPPELWHWRSLPVLAPKPFSDGTELWDWLFARSRFLQILWGSKRG